MPYSQNDEEIFILDVFANKPTGKFIDVGAYDTYRFSNVRALYEKGGWSGVLVEPAPSNYLAIADHYANDKAIAVLNIAIGEPAGEIDFYESDGDAVGTTDEAHMKKWKDGGVNYTKIKVPQMGVVDFFNQYGKDVDFLSIDTEATNIVVFRNIPEWVFERVQLLCIEHDNYIDEIEATCLKYGLTTIYVNAENILLSK